MGDPGGWSGECAQGIQSRVDDGQRPATVHRWAGEGVDLTGGGECWQDCGLLIVYHSIPQYITVYHSTDLPLLMVANGSPV